MQYYWRRFLSSLQFVDGCRRDGRDVDEIRPVYLEMGIVNECTGSAYLEMGDTKIVCSVFGPRELPRSEDFSMEVVIIFSSLSSIFSFFSSYSPWPISYPLVYFLQTLQLLPSAVAAPAV